MGLFLIVLTLALWQIIVIRYRVRVKGPKIRIRKLDYTIEEINTRCDVLAAMSGEGESYSTPVNGDLLSYYKHTGEYPEGYHYFPFGPEEIEVN